jgi:regulator of protease activity HflC (stomatin/prohibitin superfamily)
VRVVRVEIQRIDPPPDVVDSMHNQMKAERVRRAVVTEAQGVREAAITRAEGDKQAAILEAQGRAEAIERLADAERYQRTAVGEGEANATRLVFAAIHDGDPSPDLVAIRYLEALQAVADGQATKIFLPTEMGGLFGTIGGLAELLRDRPPESGLEPATGELPEA